MASGDGVDLGIAGLGPANVIGEGGNAFVYRCRQDALDREVAVKILKRASDEGTQRRFGREQRAMGRMSQHEGIVTVYESGITEKGEPYLVMPLLPRSLDDELEAQGTLPWSEAVEIVADVAETVQFAHEQGLVHRDLKPGNLMRSMSGRPLVADFGIARIVDAGATAQSAALTLTPAFSPPESLSGPAAEPTTDVYALGATLYALIEGHPPFVDAVTSKNMLALLRRVADDPVPRLTVDAPEWINGVIAAAMTKDPAQRIQSCGELAGHLRSSGSDLPAQAGSSAAPPPSATGPTIIVDTTAAAAQTDAAPPVVPVGVPPADSNSPGSSSLWMIGSAIAVVLLIIAGAVFVIANRGGDETIADGTTTTSETDQSTASSPDTDPDEQQGESTTTSTTIEASTTIAERLGEVDTTTLTVGECFNAELGGISLTVEVVDCDRPHIAQVTGVFQSPDAGGEYPGLEKLGFDTVQSCISSFSLFVGIHPAQTELFWTSYVPTFEQWTDQQVYTYSCVAVRLDLEPMTSSVKDAAADPDVALAFGDHAALLGLPVGSCFQNVDPAASLGLSFQFGLLQAVVLDSCDNIHQGQVLAHSALAGPLDGSYDATALDLEARALCGSLFPGFDQGLNAVVPDQNDWFRGDRGTVCVYLWAIPTTEIFDVT